ncbi:hypothetical protein QEN58_09665 [Halomonas alkaliantarctica]|uniref:Trimeric autotransporter adhesin n=1 Tax=Halomonas alkaliantarctica TaxID=232346 RepID=A0ABY8LGN1_9GAMM|nr:hypothetical protein [Halomonas alkaliantarctica]WGI23624.1 hypothetical protein QEN58_09665 [Halomonas alkaliantarctica]
MRFGFLNNFAAQLAAPVADDATEIELSTGAEAIATALEGADAVALTLFVVDAQGNETKREVVYATGVEASKVTIERGKEESEPQGFSAGDQIEARLTAGTLLLALESAMPTWLSQTKDNAIIIGDNIIGEGALRTVILGVNSQTGEGESNVLIGDENRVFGAATKCVVVGASASVEGFGAIAIGNLARAMNKCDYSLAIGLQTSVASSESVALGVRSSVSADSQSATAIGADSAASGVVSVALGCSARTAKDLGIAIGSAFSDKRGSIAQGALATTTVDFGEKKKRHSLSV